MLDQERIPVEHDRVFPVLYGTEHIGGHEEASFPQELAAKGRLAEQFVVCLGTDYAHKNRDLAVAVHRELAERGRRFTLVLAGPSVPYGGSRNSERQHLRDDGDVVFLPNVSSRERNWLFRHAAVVLYPTSAEGFGLVPFEAARFGSPTVIGRLRTAARDVGGPPRGRVVMGSAANSPIAWSDSSTTRCSDVSRCSATLVAADRYSWRRTAEEFLRMYRVLLARPPR